MSDTQDEQDALAYMLPFDRFGYDGVVTHDVLRKSLYDLMNGVGDIAVEPSSNVTDLFFRALAAVPWSFPGFHSTVVGMAIKDALAGHETVPFNKKIVNALNHVFGMDMAPGEAQILDEAIVGAMEAQATALTITMAQKMPDGAKSILSDKRLHRTVAIAWLVLDTQTGFYMDMYTTMSRPYVPLLPFRK